MAVLKKYAADGPPISKLCVKNRIYMDLKNYIKSLPTKRKLSDVKVKIITNKVRL
jgi:hypothetical protein